MSAQDNMEKVLRELHVLLSKSNPYERDSNYLVVNKKEMLDILKQLAVCMSEVMDEYELTQQGREQAQRENRKIGEEIINDARAKAEDVYAASVMYTDEALRRILDIMDEANESVKAVYDSMGEKLANERKLVSGDKLELKSLLQDLKDTDKYMGIIEERNKKIAKEKKWKEEDTESSPYAAVKPEIKINRDYFEQQGISFEEPEEEQPEEKTEKAAPEISVNLDSEYFIPGLTYVKSRNYFYQTRGCILSNDSYCINLYLFLFHWNLRIRITQSYTTVDFMIGRNT